MNRNFTVLVAAVPIAAIAGCPAPADSSLAGACWDTNSNGLADGAEDVNGDGVVDVFDCRGADGLNGRDGVDGAAAAELLFGDGSSGARVISGNSRFETAADANQHWTDFTVAADVTLRIQSGAVIRCSGKFANYGTIIVEGGAQGGDRASFDSTTLEGASRSAALGVNTLAASGGEVGDATSFRSGGLGGDGISEFEARIALRISTRAGSGGGAALEGAGEGGGGLTVFAQGSIENFGTILAEGANSSDDGGGGGGGGVLILASQTSVTHAATGSLQARGGQGGPMGGAAGPGGGGGGGIIHLISPMVELLGATSAAGGAPGAAAEGAVVTAALRSGGGGGGGSGGAGGSGGGVNLGGAVVPDAAQGGTNGYVLTTLQKPELIFR